HDQTRGWFYSQLAASCICFQRAPYESVLMHGWVLDPKGQPMSKSRGNVIEPASVIKEYGADALRFYMMRTNAPWEDIAFQFEGVKNARKTLNILWNVCNFATSYMALDKFDPALVNDEIIKNAFRKEDLWLISRCEKLKNDVTRHLNSYELHKATRALEEFILEDLSRWYVRLVRDRMWKEEGDSDKLAAYKTLHDVLMNVTKLLAPFCPHIAEEIYQHLDGSMESIHMLDWPAADLTRTNDKLESAMKTIQEIVEIVTKERQAQGVKLRWPLRRIIIKANSNEVMNSIKSLESILLSQANVKTIEYVDPGEEWEELILNVVPNPHAIGKVYRQWSSKIAVLLKTRPAKQVKQSVEKGEYYLGVEGQLLKIEPNMVSFTVSLPPDIIGTKFSAGELYMDFKITPEIEAEGYAREIIRRIQQMRKDAKLDIEEYIKVQLSASEKIQEFIESHKSYVMNETRARDIVFVDEPDGEMVVEWDIEGEKVVIGITSLHTKDAIKEFSMIPGLSKEASIALAEAGYRNIEGLRKAGTEALSKVSGLDKNDLRKILHYFEKSEPQVIETCPNCGVPVKMDSLVCSSCGKVLKEDKAMPKEEFIMYLLRIPRMNRVKAELLYDSGFNNLEKIKNAKLEELRALGGIGSKTAEAIFNYALYGGFEKNLKCATCGAIIRPNEISCSSCGASVSIGSQEVEEVEALESPVMEDIQLEKSFTYLIKEEKSERSYYLFKQALSKGFKGFCVTRNYPLKIRSRYDIGDVPIIWLSNVGKENSLRPKDLEKLSVSLEQFLSSTENAIILLDGLEYLITNNNFITVLRFVQSLRDQVAIREAILLLALNPSTLAQHELNLLEKEVDTTI
ncbi:MAG: class I tRNA ligase family protein, partial [Methanomassiliicoccales archaeon]